MAVLSDKQFFFIAGIVVLAGGYAAYRASKATDQVLNVVGETLKTDLNPANQDNFVNRAFTDSVRSVTGKENWTLGGWIYDLFHDPYDPNAPVKTEASNPYTAETNDFEIVPAFDQSGVIVPYFPGGVAQ